MERILGKDLSTYKAISISLGKSKNDNSDGVKSRFAAITLKDKFSIGARKVRLVMFEDEIGTEAYEALRECVTIGEDNKPLKDPKGGAVVSLMLVKKGIAERKAADEDGEDPLMLDTLMVWEGGLTLPYKFPTGPRYANNADGRPTKDKDGNRIVKSEIDVFCQVKDVVIKEDGSRDYTFVSGMNPNTRGERLMRTFFKEAVNKGSADASQNDGGVDTSTEDNNEPDF